MPIQSQVTAPIRDERFQLILDPVRDQSVNQQLRKIQDFSNSLVRKLRTPQELGELMVTRPSDGRVIFWAGSKPGATQLYTGMWAYDAYLGGDDPENAPVYVEDGRVNIVLGDADDAAGLTVLDGDGDVVVQMGLFDTDKYGIYAANAWFGTDPDEALVSVVDGELEIAGGNIYVGPGATGKGGNLYVYDSSDVVVELGTFAVAASVVVSSTNAGTVNTSAAHGLLVGDWTRLAGNSNAGHNRVWQVTAVGGANTFSVSGMTGAGTGGTSTKQEAGAWAKIIRAGGTSSVDAPFVTADDGSLRIGVDGGSRMEVSAAGDVDLYDADIQIDSGTSRVRLDAATMELRFTDTAGGNQLGYYGREQFRAAYSSTGGGPHVGGESGITGSSFEVTGPSGTKYCYMEANGVNEGFDTSGGYKVGGTEIVNSSREAHFSSLSVDDVTTTRSNLGLGSMATQSMVDYYTRTDIDSMVATLNLAIETKSPIGHSHSSISITGTAGTVAHTHTGTVS